MGLIAIDAKQKQKRSTIPGTVPSLGVSPDHTDNTWGDSDVYPSEFFHNIPDEKLWLGVKRVAFFDDIPAPVLPIATADQVITDAVRTLKTLNNTSSEMFRIINGDDNVTAQFRSDRKTKFFGDMGIGDDPLPGARLRVYATAGDGINAYVTAASARALVAQSDGANGIGFQANAGGVGGIGARCYGYTYGAYLNTNNGNNTFGALLEGTSGSGSAFLDGYVFGRVQTAPPSSRPSFEWQGYGTSNGDTLFVIKNGGGAETMKAQGDGIVRFDTGIYVPGYTNVNEVRSVFQPSCRTIYGSSLIHYSIGDFGVAYTSHRFDTATALTTAGCKVFEFANNGTVLFGMDKDGRIYANGLPTASTGLAAGYLFKDDNGDGTSTIKIIN